MTIDLFDVTPVIERLLDQVPDLKQVKGAVGLASASAEGVKQFPCAFVIPLSEAPGEQLLATMATEQRVLTAFGVILVVRNVADVRGAKALDALTPLRKLVHQAIYGWTADALVFDPIERGPARLLQLDNLTLWWQDDCTTQSLIRSV